MKFKRKDTEIIYNVTNPDTLALFKDNDAYEVVEDKPVEKKPRTTKK